QAAEVPGAAAFRARLGLVVNPHLAKADPARQPFEKAVALRQLTQRAGRARRQQAEVAGIFRNLGPRTPIEEEIKTLHRDAADQRLVGAMRLGGIDDVAVL